MTTSDITYNGEKITVHFNYYKGFRGSWEEPPEPESVEIDAVYFNGIDVISILCSECLEMIEGELWKQQEKDREKYEDARAEALYEERRLER